MLPDDWLRKYGLLADLGNRLGRRRPAVRQGAGRLARRPPRRPARQQGRRRFTKVRKELHAFEGIEPFDAPPGFQGELRPYQREGLGWLDYLRGSASAASWPTTWASARPSRCSPCSSDDGCARQAKGPSLIVVPRSLVFNWLQEAAKFTPKLRVLDYTGPAPTPAPREDFDDYDLIVTTYGTLRPDIAELADDRVRLRDPRRGPGDQERRQPVGQGRAAVEGPAPAGDQRHADREPPRRTLVASSSSSTPACSASARVFKRYASAGAAGQDEEARRLLAKALRPVHPPPHQAAGRRGSARQDRADPLLRPGSRPSSRLYDELRVHYRDGPAHARTSTELNRSKIEVLEALLAAPSGRLPPRPHRPRAGRRAVGASSTCCSTRSQEVIDEGHKVLVFSQFTSVPGDRPRSGSTQRRSPTNTSTAGPATARPRSTGSRTTRTARLPDQPEGRRPRAEPDRRRIRLPARPLVEPRRRGPGHRPLPPHRPDPARLRLPPDLPRHRREKILELQQKKRDLADAILNADNRVISALTRDDLEFLLS